MMKKTIAGSLLALVSVFLIYGCTGGVKTNPNAPFKGVVEDGSKETFLKVANATVWLIPATDVAAMGKTPIEVKKNSPNDEPLEDNLAANRGRYLNAKTNARGEFSFADVPGGKYFVYVEPATVKYLPGGDKSRKALGTERLAEIRATARELFQERRTNRPVRPGRWEERGDRPGPREGRGPAAE